MATRPLTVTALRVLRVLLNGETWGNRIRDQLDIETGTLYPLLRRLQADGYLLTRWERDSEENRGRPRRHFYRIDPRRADEVRKYLWELSRELDPT